LQKPFKASSALLAVVSHLWTAQFFEFSAFVLETEPRLLWLRLNNSPAFYSQNAFAKGANLFYVVRNVEHGQLKLVADAG
jgi:hypothetical protein